MDKKQKYSQFIQKSSLSEDKKSQLLQLLEILPEEECQKITNILGNEQTARAKIQEKEHHELQGAEHLCLSNMQAVIQEADAAQSKHILDAFNSSNP